MTIALTLLILTWIRRGLCRRQSVGRANFQLSLPALVPYPVRCPGAIGFDWVTADGGGVPWFISRPRKKLMTQ